MIRRYCDVCKKEIEQNVVTERIKGEVIVRGERVLVEITCGIGREWNGGDLCVNCLVEAIVSVTEVNWIPGVAAAPFSPSTLETR